MKNNLLALDSAYLEGFIKACDESGIDPAGLIKPAQLPPPASEYTNVIKAPKSTQELRMNVPKMNFKGMSAADRQNVMKQVQEQDLAAKQVEYGRGLMQGAGQGLANIGRKTLRTVGGYMLGGIPGAIIAHTPMGKSIANWGKNVLTGAFGGGTQDTQYQPSYQPTQMPAPVNLQFPQTSNIWGSGGGRYSNVAPYAGGGLNTWGYHPLGAPGLSVPNPWGNPYPSIYGGGY